MSGFFGDFALVRLGASVCWLGAVGAVVGWCAGCQPYRIEHHKRPAFYQKAAANELPDEVVLEDGTIIKYSTTETQSTFGRGGDDQGVPFQIREEKSDGEVVLRALVPEHVLSNTLICLRNEEYQLLWDQMLAQRTKEAYEESGQGFAEFERFFRAQRHELVATLNRMVAGMPTQEVAIVSGREGAKRCQLRPQFVGDLKYKMVDMAKEGPELRLLMIR